ncbi:MAG: type II CAAX endopeptidase family protein [Sporolactobacillus sp.]
MHETKKRRRELKRQIRGFAWILNAQHLLLLFVVIAYAIGSALAVVAEHGTRANLMHLMTKMEASGWPMILAVAFAIIPVIIFRRDKFFTHDLAVRNKKITIKVFLIALVVVLGVSTVLGLLRYPTDALLHAIGFTAKPSEQVLDGSTTISMLVYACVIAPIFEEAMYRGFVLRSLERFGSFFAIFTSALLFGLMHENIIQFPYAFGIGLIFGYLAKTYSIRLTILLHIANNSLSELFSDFVPSSGALGTSLNLAFSIVPVLLAIWIIWTYRQPIRDWFRTNRPSRPIFIAFYTSVPVILLILINIFNTLVGGISKL